MNASRIAPGITLACMLVLAPAWMFLAMLGGNGMNTRQGNVLLGGVGGCLLLMLVATPWLAWRLARIWQATFPDALAAIAAAVVAMLAAAIVLSLATFLLLGILAR